MTMPKKEVAQAEDTPAYAVLQQFGLLDASYRKEHFDDIFDSPNDITANSSRADTIKKRFKWGVYWTPGCGLILYVSASNEPMTTCVSSAAELLIHSHVIALHRASAIQKWLSRLVTCAASRITTTSTSLRVRESTTSTTRFSIRLAIRFLSNSKSLSVATAPLSPFHRESSDTQRIWDSLSCYLLVCIRGLVRRCVTNEPLDWMSTWLKLDHTRFSQWTKGKSLAFNWGLQCRERILLTLHSPPLATPQLLCNHAEQWSPSGA